MGQPFIKFFGTDWRSDSALRMCSAAARGVWIDCLTIMVEAEPYGHLTINGKPATPAQIAALTVTPLPVVKKALAELRENNVYSVTPEGVIYSRRLVRDAQKLMEAREHGKKGGNPALKGDGKPKDDGSGISRGVNPHDKGGGYGPGITEGDNPHGKPEARARDQNSVSSLRSETAPSTLADLENQVWNTAKAFLAGRGVQPKQIGGLIGRWLKQIGPPDAQVSLLRVLASAQANCRGDVIEYVEAAIKRIKTDDRHNSRSPAARAAEIRRRGLEGLAQAVGVRLRGLEGIASAFADQFDEGADDADDRLIEQSM